MAYRRLVHFHSRPRAFKSGAFCKLACQQRLFSARQLTSSTSWPPSVMRTPPPAVEDSYSLTKLLVEFEQLLRPTADQVKEAERFETVLRKVCAELGGELHSYGSCSNGTFMQGSDVDLTWMCQEPHVSPSALSQPPPPPPPMTPPPPPPDVLEQGHEEQVCSAESTTSLPAADQMLTEQALHDEAPAIVSSPDLLVRSEQKVPLPPPPDFAPPPMPSSLPPAFSPSPPTSHTATHSPPFPPAAPPPPMPPTSPPDASPSPPTPHRATHLPPLPPAAPPPPMPSTCPPDSPLSPHIAAHQLPLPPVAPPPPMPSTSPLDSPLSSPALHTPTHLPPFPPATPPPSPSSSSLPSVPPLPPLPPARSISGVRRRSENLAWQRIQQQFGLLLKLRWKIESMSLSGVHKVWVVKARVPVLKLLDTHGNVLCDVSVNNTEGLRNTRLVRMLCEQSPALGPFVRILKHWARQRGIGDRATGGFSTYTLVLMALRVFQERKSAECPSPEQIHRLCQEILDGDLSTVPSGVWLQGDPGWHTQLGEDLPILLSEFFHFFMQPEFANGGIVRLCEQVKTPHIHTENCESGKGDLQCLTPPLSPPPPPPPSESFLPGLSCETEPAELDAENSEARKGVVPFSALPLPPKSPPPPSSSSSSGPGTLEVFCPLTGAEVQRSRKDDWEHLAQELRRASELLSQPSQKAIAQLFEARATQVPQPAVPPPPPPVSPPPPPDEYVPLVSPADGYAQASGDVPAPPRANAACVPPAPPAIEYRASL
eukprot:TRINITY_DN46213_c0_g1_i1.p1 TRINITY_DN46213_c0_g1~~TRINITY_DN46213_c0_g1_i1.p1  ORF type:complete len:767 (-),score=103.13 TRINITY_DN46213_c0_g1_i1:27-2327(-)